MNELNVLKALDSLSQANVGPLEREAVNGIRAAVAELVEVAREVADEYMGMAAACQYHHDEDEVGTRVCCGVVSYEPHAADCPAVRLRAALAKFEH